MPAYSHLGGLEANVLRVPGRGCCAVYARSCSTLAFLHSASALLPRLLDRITRCGGSRGSSGLIKMRLFACRKPDYRHLMGRAGFIMRDCVHPASAHRFPSLVPLKVDEY